LTTLRLVLGDQLSADLATLQDYHTDDVVLMCEVSDETTYVKHHPKKIAFVLAAMRHFAAELALRGWQLRYVTLTDPANTGSFTGEVSRAVRDLGITHLVVTEPGEYRVRQMIDDWPTRLGITVECRADDRFLCSSDWFKRWARGKKQLRMEYFYRAMRETHGILMEGDRSPSGGAWNYDKENRKPPKRGLTSPKRLQHPRSTILDAVIQMVGPRFAEHFGQLEPFHLAVTREQALRELDDFVSRILPHFGDYQDAMVRGEAFLNHSLLSTYLNAGLLLPLEVCRRAERAYREGQAPLPAVEGFIRQILGWREFVRGIYWLHMPTYGTLNVLQAVRPLPDFYWGAPTHMACMAEAVSHTRMHAYSHHIQRLMVTGNFALLAGLDVKQVQAWYLAVYSDAYEWVEMPNTLGMALFGDGGIVGSKPYAASGKYIKKMSNFCEQCRYDPDETVGELACPFNALYWDFMARHRAQFETNPRVSLVFGTWERMGETRQDGIRQQAALTLERMQRGEL